MRAHPEKSLERASSVIAELPDIQMILVYNVDVASYLVRVCLQYYIMLSELSSPISASP